MNDWHDERSLLANWLLKGWDTIARVPVAKAPNQPPGSDSRSSLTNINDELVNQLKNA